MFLINNMYYYYRSLVSGFLKQTPITEKQYLKSSHKWSIHINLVIHNESWTRNKTQMRFMFQCSKEERDLFKTYCSLTIAKGIRKCFWKITTRERHNPILTNKHSCFWYRWCYNMTLVTMMNNINNYLSRLGYLAKAK